jgi:16S rRNA (cytosine1402-N4)-methyltransferase
MGGQGTLICLDRDPDMIRLARRRFQEAGIESESIRWIVGSFANLTERLAAAGIGSYQRILYDLGLNSLQIADAARGFSFAAEGPLDARFSREEAIPTLAEHLARIDPRRLEEVIRELGGERFARRVARAIVRRRERGPIETTAQLASIIRSAVPPVKGYRRIDSATRTFQALRMLVNSELDHLERGLKQGINGLTPKGRIAVVSFHSGEDRLVKEAFRRRDARRAGWVGQAEAAEGPPLKVLTPKPLRPSEAECTSNPRARSARLRAAERML